MFWRVSSLAPTPERPIFGSEVAAREEMTSNVSADCRETKHTREFPNVFGARPEFQQKRKGELLADLAQLQSVRSDA